jgi:hypothetical protein
MNRIEIGKNVFLYKKDYDRMHEFYKQGEKGMMLAYLAILKVEEYIKNLK